MKPKYAVYVPHTAGRFAAKRFRKAQCPIVERLVNSLMMHGRNNGKKLMAVRIVKHAMEIIHLLTDQNPVQVVVDAIINAGPREDATRIGSAGVVRRQAVDMSPLRRVNQAIYLLTTGAREAAFRNVKTISECLADELINAAKGSSNSYAIKKKDELERVVRTVALWFAAHRHRLAALRRNLAIDLFVLHNCTDPCCVTRVFHITGQGEQISCFWCKLKVEGALGAVEFYDFSYRDGRFLIQSQEGFVDNTRVQSSMRLLLSFPLTTITHLLLVHLPPL